MEDPKRWSPGEDGTLHRSFFNTTELFQEPAPLLIGERRNSTGSKAFRELIIRLRITKEPSTVGSSPSCVDGGATVWDVQCGSFARGKNGGQKDIGWRIIGGTLLTQEDLSLSHSWPEWATRWSLPYGGEGSQMGFGGESPFHIGEFPKMCGKKFPGVWDLATILGGAGWAP